MIVLASDHNGSDARDFLSSCLLSSGYPVVDLGPPINSEKKVDYIDYAEQTVSAILKNPALRGILICGTGIGMSIVANRFIGIRASLVSDVFTAQKTREHNDSNVLVMGSWKTSKDLMWKITTTWLGESYGKGRHEKRVERLNDHSSLDIVLVPGVFDIIHGGHIGLLSFAKTLGKVVVCLNSDESVEIIKGKRPVNDVRVRMGILRHLDLVDEVVIIEKDKTVGLISSEMSAKYVVKGSNFVEEFVRSNDQIPSTVEIKIVPLSELFSSSSLREKIKNA